MRSWAGYKSSYSKAQNIQRLLLYNSSCQSEKSREVHTISKNNVSILHFNAFVLFWTKMIIIRDFLSILCFYIVLFMAFINLVIHVVAWFTADSRTNVEISIAVYWWYSTFIVYNLQKLFHQWPNIFLRTNPN